MSLAQPCTRTAWPLSLLPYCPSPAPFDSSDQPPAPAGLTAGEAQPGSLHAGSEGQGSLCSGERFSSWILSPQVGWEPSPQRGGGLDDVSATASPGSVTSCPPGEESHGHQKGQPQGLGPVAWEGLSGTQNLPTSVSTDPGGSGTLRKPYTCKQCGRSFDWKSVFVIHHRTHVAGQNARTPAQALGAAEKLPQGLQEPAGPRHPRRTLTGSRNYACDQCGHCFSWKSQLVIHRKSHAGQRHHSCSDCGRSFDWKSQLVIHRKSHRPETS